jgi:predicted nucleic acid-binding Zn ribbon protein
MYTLRELLSDAVSGLLGSQRARQAAVLSAWPKVVGDAHARHARPLGIRGRTLVVATDLSALLFELGLRRDALVGALNREVGERAIDEIQVVLRSLPPQEDSP